MDKLVGFARKKRLGDLLVDAGVISQDQLVKALQVQKTEKQGEKERNCWLIRRNISMIQ